MRERPPWHPAATTPLPSTVTPETISGLGFDEPRLDAIENDLHRRLVSLGDPDHCALGDRAGDVAVQLLEGGAERLQRAGVLDRPGDDVAALGPHLEPLSL